MRVALVVTDLQTNARFRGTGTYIRVLIEGLAQIDRINQYRLLSFAGMPVPVKGLPNNFRCLATVPHLPTRAGPMISHQILVPLLSIGLGFDVIHYPFAAATRPSVATAAVWSGTNSVVTLFDLTPLRYPSLFLRSLRERQYYRFALNALATSKAIICASESTAQDALQLLGVSRSKLYVAPLAMPSDTPQLFGNAAQFAARLGDLVPYVLYIGGNHANKNLRRVLHAVSMLRADGHGIRLAVLGGTQLRRTDMPAGFAEVPDWVHRFESLSPAAVAALYVSASALVFPSLYEGFGYPVLEAMHHGVPVVSSNTSSIPEVAGDATILVDPTNVAAIAAALKQILAEPELAHRMRERGYEQAARFTPALTARATLDAYEAAYCTYLR